MDWLKQLVEILRYLHDREYFYRDIKPKNIMLAPDGRLVLIDFGAGRKVSETYLTELSREQSGGLPDGENLPQEPPRPQGGRLLVDPIQNSKLKTLTHRYSL